MNGCEIWVKKKRRRISKPEWEKGRETDRVSRKEANEGKKKKSQTHACIINGV